MAAKRSWSENHWHASHEIDAPIEAWARDVRAALALHDSWFDHKWTIDDAPPGEKGEGWWNARCAVCGLRLEPLFHHAREIGKPAGRGAS